MVVEDDRQILSAVAGALDSERNAAKARMDEAQRLASLGTLAAGVGHEITNPLSYVIDALETMQGLVDGLRGRPGAIRGSALDLESSLSEMASLVERCQNGTE